MSQQTRTYLIALCSLLSPAFAALAAAMPPPWSWVLAVLALFSAGVAGLVSKVPAFLVGRPLVSAALAGPLAILATVLVDQALAAPEGLARAGLLGVAVLLSGLAGKPLPQPRGTPPATTLQVLAAVVAASLFSGCAAPTHSAQVLGPGAFSFTPSPTVPLEECFAMGDRQSRTAGASEVLTYASGGGAVVSGFLALFLESKAATATSALVSAGAAGGALYASHRAKSMDELLALYGCPRPVAK